VLVEQGLGGLAGVEMQREEQVRGGVPVTRIDLERAPVGGDGLHNRALTVKRRAQVDQCGRTQGLELERPPVQLGGSHRKASAPQRHAQVPERQRVVGAFCKEALPRRALQTDLVRHAQPFGEQAIALDILAIGRDGAQQLLESSVAATELPQQLRQVARRAGVGCQRQRLLEELQRDQRARLALAAGQRKERSRVLGLGERAQHEPELGKVSRARAQRGKGGLQVGERPLPQPGVAGGHEVTDGRLAERARGVQRGAFIQVRFLAPRVVLQGLPRGGEGLGQTPRLAQRIAEHAPDLGCLRL
jgi:hypothetical protein